MPAKQRYSTAAWQRTRADALRQAHGRCAECGTTIDVVVHHTGPVDQPTSVRVLCRRHHRQLHRPELSPAAYQNRVWPPKG